MTTTYKDDFKVGDRVIIDGVRIGNAHMANGKHGTIMSLEKGKHGKTIFGVELDEPMYNHDCFGKTKPGHGYYAYTEELLHEQPPELEEGEVRRCAEVGEYVKITKPNFIFLQVGDIVRVSSVDFSDGTIRVRECDLARPSGANVPPNYEWVIYHYVVLEGYKP